MLNTELRMKRTPTLEFIYDATSERAERLSRLIAEAAPDREDEEQ
jgi:ribosome-binding factor A